MRNTHKGAKDLIVKYNILKAENEKLKLDKQALTEQLRIGSVSNWVTIESNIPPEVCTDVMVKYKDGRTEVAYFDGDNRFYIEKDDRDVSEKIISWHKLPE